MKHIAKTPAWVELIGWAGTALILIGYGIFSTGLIADIGLYHTFNLIGSIGVAILSYYRRVWQPAIINTAFALFAAIALLRISL